MRKAEIGISTVAMIILAVIFLVFIAMWATGHLIPGTQNTTDNAVKSVQGNALECTNLTYINVDSCLSGSDCDISENYTDVNKYPIRIPTPTAYWIDVELKRIESGAESAIAPDVDDCSNNHDPDIYPYAEYQPLIYEFRIGDKTVRHKVDHNLPANGWQNVSLLVGNIPAGSKTLEWRIITDWNTSCGGGTQRYGELRGDIRVYCEVFGQ